MVAPTRSSVPGHRFFGRWKGLVVLLVLIATGSALASRLATVYQSSGWRQVTDPGFPLPPTEDGSIVVTLSGDRPLSLVTPDPDFMRVDDHTFITRFPWNWTGPRSVVLVDDQGVETALDVVPQSPQPYAPLTHQIPVIHISCDSTALWDPATGIYTTGDDFNFLHHGSDWERLARFEYFEPGIGRVIDEPIGLRIHGGYSRNFYQKGLRFYFDDYGTSDELDYPIFAHGPTIFERLIIRPSRYDDSCINSNWAEGLFGDLGHLVSRYRFAAVYLNREYWGAYSLRERLDKKFFKTTWGLGFGGLNFIKDGETKVGTADGWWNFLAGFADVIDAEDPVWFAAVRRNLDLASYIDWQIINLYGVAGDNGFAWNVGLMQTGDQPWRVVMWDEDLLLRSADLHTNMFRFLTARDQSEWNRYRAPDDLRPWNEADQQWLTMFRTLLGNGEFRALFRSRLEHLLGGAMTADELVDRVAELAVEQRPEIPAHAARWEGFQTDWYEDYVTRTEQWLRDRRPIFLAQADSFYNEFGLPAWSDDYTGLVINEFLADNTTGAQDEGGETTGWLELYNGGPGTIDLTGVWLTDDLSQPTGWEFPAVMLPAGQWLTVWCDGQAGQGPLHADLDLRPGGGQIGLSAPLTFGNGLIDSYTYGPQTADVSTGRRTDGAPEWITLDPPTFARSNNDSSAAMTTVPVAAVLGRNYPNPFNPRTTLSYGLPTAGRIRIRVFDPRGRLVRVLLDETRPAGRDRVVWRGVDDAGRPVPSGVYVARLEFGGAVRQESMVLVR